MMILKAFQRVRYDLIDRLSAGKLLSSMHRSGPNDSMHHRKRGPQCSTSSDADKVVEAPGYAPRSTGRSIPPTFMFTFWK